ncbi:GNAT family N-acetyltransferase [Frondihabitans sp. VKM Ac-2883]|uniref:GNAT family N-acetyltransferase n=1 Tax=Frondihabitans sp. VKM Ac-2883 TaxID=2783823 RepID=UPI00188AD411|nr:GNAT family N-acetyltransferase [Frondihabitans sp. VKM Ac-2883]
MPVTVSSLETDRLLLRPLTPADLDDVFAYQSDPEALRYMLWPVRSRSEAAEHLARRSTMTHLEHEGDSLVLAVTTKSEPGRVMGEVNVRLTSVDSRQSEVGWILNPAFQGRGYAFEAATRMIELCVDDLGSHRVHAELDPLNAGSVALCRKLGMRQEAHLVEDLFYKGRWSDTGIYAILASEWRQRHDLRPR